jgi:hypothetical protein
MWLSLILSLLLCNSQDYSGNMSDYGPLHSESGNKGVAFSINHRDSLHLILESRVREYYSIMSSRDWEAYRDFFWPQATLSTIWQAPGDSEPEVHISTISEFIEATPEGPDSQPVFEEVPLRIEIDVRGNLAIAWVNYEARFGSEDHLMEWKGTDIFTWMKHRNEWRIIALAYSSED